jgi:hypothetical protein
LSVGFSNFSLHHAFFDPPLQHDTHTAQQVFTWAFTWAAAGGGDTCAADPSPAALCCFLRSPAAGACACRHSSTAPTLHPYLQISRDSQKSLAKLTREVTGTWCYKRQLPPVTRHVCHERGAGYATRTRERILRQHDDHDLRSSSTRLITDDQHDQQSVEAVSRRVTRTSKLVPHERVTLLSITACSPSLSGATKAISSKPAATTAHRPPREAESDAQESIQLMTVPPKAVPCMFV